MPNQPNTARSDYEQDWNYSDETLDALAAAPDEAPDHIHGLIRDIRSARALLAQRDAELAARDKALAEAEALVGDWRRYAEDAGCHDQWRACRLACADDLAQALATAQGEKGVG